MTFNPLPDRLGERAATLAREVEQMEADMREARVSLERLAERASVLACWRAGRNRATYGDAPAGT